MPRKTEQPLPSDLALSKGLPTALSFEQFVLGSIMVDDSVFESVATSLNVLDFETQRHQRIWVCMEDMHKRGDRIDRALVGHELQKKGLLEHVTLDYLVSLDTGIPININLDSYVEKILRASALRKIVFLTRDIATRALADADEPGDILADLGKAAEKIQTGAQQQGDGKTPEQVIAACEGGIQSFLDPSSRKRGLPIPIKRLDFMMNGLQRSEMFIVGARPSMGKSSWLLNMVEELTVNPRQHRPGAIFSLEMSNVSLLNRLICARARVDQGKYRAGYLGREERGRIQLALSDVTDCPLWLYDRASMTIEDIERETRRLVRDEGIEYVGIDHLQLCSTKEKYENQNLKIGAITRRIHIFTKECNVATILLSQLGRASEKRPGAQSEPQLGDLLDSGRIEADSDTVMFIFRPEVYNRNKEDLRGIAKFILAKQRNGATGVVECRWQANIGRFENVSNDTEPDGYPEEPEPDPPRSFHEKEEVGGW